MLVIDTRIKLLLFILINFMVFGLKDFILGGRGGALFLNSVNQRDQRVMFKVSHSSSMQAHDKYLSTYMSQENKNEVLDKPRLFGTENSEYESAKVPEHFKFIISPENQNVNLKVLASEFIRRVETMTGYKLLWQGAVHTDTARISGLRR